MDVTSLLNNHNARSNEGLSLLENENLNLRESSNCQLSPGLETDLLDYSEAMTANINSAQLQQRGFESLSNNLPLLNKTNVRSPVGEASLSSQGISPALINSRATSLALESMSNRSTPVPRPVEQETFGVHLNTATSHPILSPTPLAPNQNVLPGLNQTPALEGPEDIIVDNPQLETVINLFNNQWLMFVQARENQNVPMMRFALQQAVGSQEVIRNLAGGEEMLRICENWIACEVLADLERLEQNNPTPQLARHQRSRTWVVANNQHKANCQLRDCRPLKANIWLEATICLHPRHHLLNPHQLQPTTTSTGKGNTTRTIVRAAPSTNSRTPSKLFQTTNLTIKHKWPRHTSHSSDVSTPPREETGEDTGGITGI
ncbi:uncharacterized protein PGTG_06803 [Puccinia graminis f. sp. tritici CRL 75-36-700-3]|uniref:Uncharacterized protein n=1 Tax=Puccinia graminis f. sp. tritici (strain CRL 75-36-700-3 / race SCCL) TaxID=418459 RepID=E3KAR3_PUCGT|nr:uncharacterized protein PGTG_06803 [Puccinia graminis f. sp. tritici CRL 75-36-700-3]EFP81182.1 hypothetical protein PGTG_06803 [Puccinia graminis f. sp. tritici CRL 75-36-700-3]